MTVRADGPPGRPPQIVHHVDADVAARLTDEAYSGAAEMAQAMTQNGASEDEIAAFLEMARYLESKEAARNYGEIDPASGQDSLSPEEQAYEANQSLTAAAAPDEMKRHVEETLLTPTVERAPPFDPRTLHTDLPR